MAEYPSLPLFTDAYMADTRHLTTLQHGAYLLLLMTAWRTPNCSLPNDDTYLSRVTGMDKRTWAINKLIIMSFWKLNDKGEFQQGRLKDERNYVEQKRNKNSAAGKASALKRNNRDSTPVQPKANINPTPTPTPLTNTNVLDEIVIDFKKVIFNEGLAYVCKTTGKPEAQVRSMLGKWIRDYGEGGTARAIIEAQSKSIMMDSISYIEKVLKNENNSRNNASSSKPNKSERARLAILESAQELGYAD